MSHASDCAVHNMPAMPNQHCDCGADLKHNVALLDRIAELEAALRPFAKQLEYWGDDRMPEWDRPPNEALPEIAPRLWMDGKGRTFGEAATAIFSYGDLRRARELLDK